ncbi:hypothetical protein F5878DRAFT_619800 [Lentinula raphanica]|uniref:REJ domain-containing protein n=1 Tax=Lentinula raphanica TaxID=153919 RepID=A0AA38P8L0_9AGAR|nr:hypothetical protein F5878DRAFT_619800 [Lentinula raphanica]
MVQILEPIITPAPRLPATFREYYLRQIDSDSNAIGASAGLSGDGDAGASAGNSLTDTGDSPISGQASATSGNGDGSGDSNQTDTSSSSSTSDTSSTSPSTTTSATTTTTPPPTTTFDTSVTTTSQTSSSISSSTTSTQTSNSTNSSSDSTSSQSSSSTTPTSESNISTSSSSTITSSPSSSSNTSSPSLTYVTIVTTEPDGSVSTLTVPSSLSPQSPNSKSTATRTATIIGSTVGSVLFLILLAILVSLFCWRRRRNRKLGFIEALTRRVKEGRGAGGVGLLDGEFDDDEEYRDEIAGVHMRERNINAHSPQPSLGAGSVVSLSGSTQNRQNANYPYNSAPTLYRARASDSGSMFHEEGVWPPPNHGTQFVDPFVPARELSKDSELGSIVDQVMGPNDSTHSLPSGLPPGAAPAVIPGVSSAAAISSNHARGTSGSSIASTTPKKPSPLAKTTSNPEPPRPSILVHTQNHSNPSLDANTTLTTSPLTTIQPKNWLERQPKTPSPRNASLSLPPPLNLSTSTPPSAFANSASSLVSTYGVPQVGSPPTSAASQKQTKRVSWGELPTPSRPSSRPGSSQGSIAGGIGEAM